MDQKKATLTLPNGKTIELPFIEGKMGKPAIDISQLSKHGLHTYDPGFMSTALAALQLHLLMVKRVFYFIVVIQLNN